MVGIWFPAPTTVPHSDIPHYSPGSVQQAIWAPWACVSFPIALPFFPGNTTPAFQAFETFKPTPYVGKHPLVSGIRRAGAWHLAFRPFWAGAGREVGGWMLALGGGQTLLASGDGG